MTGWLCLLLYCVVFLVVVVQVLAFSDGNYFTLLLPFYLPTSTSIYISERGFNSVFSPVQLHIAFCCVLCIEYLYMSISI